MALLCKLIRYGLVVCLSVILAIHAQAFGAPAAWQISETSNLVRYTTHGTLVHGHQFGFAKRAGLCEADNLWLSWSSINPQVMKLIGSEVTFLIDVDGKRFNVGVNLVTANSLSPNTTIAVFTNFTAGPDFVDLLSRSNKVRITISGPQDARGLFDVRSEEFTLVGFEAARRQAKKACEERVTSNVAPLVFGSNAGAIAESW